jgi:hypothetical protein
MTDLTPLFFGHMTVLDAFNIHTGRQIDKWAHYFPIYERHFARYVNCGPRVLEIGIDHGGSLQMWKQYFGRDAEIVGVDVDPRCKEYEEDRIEIHIADQCKLPDLGMFDIIIDDGSHICAHQSITFRNLWPKTGGVYLIEDCHNGYPLLDPHPSIQYRYPWVIVAEKPRRIIRGSPSRELRNDEAAARKLFGPLSVETTTAPSPTHSLIGARNDR